MAITTPEAPPPDELERLTLVAVFANVVTEHADKLGLSDREMFAVVGIVMGRRMRAAADLAPACQSGAVH